MTYTANNVEIKVEPFKEVYDAANPIFRNHYNEAESFSKPDLDLDVDKYTNAEDQGTYVLFSMRFKDSGELIGYAGYMVAPLARNKNLKMAYQDFMYVRPENRSLALAKDFLTYTDSQMKIRGISVMYRSSSGKRDISNFLKRYGYVLGEKIFMKEL